MDDRRKPKISAVAPVAAIPGGEFQIRGTQLTGGGRARVLMGDTPANVLVGSDDYIIARVPDSATLGEIIVEAESERSAPWRCEIGLQIADSLHPVTNPMVDFQGNVFTTFSGSRGKKTSVSVFKIDTNYQLKPFLSDLMNATALAIDREGLIYVSSRYDGVVYQVTPKGNMSVYCEGMGVATGLAFDKDENLYVGDRSGTIFKIARSRQIYVFCTLEPSIAAYHMTFGPDGHLYVTGPTTSSFDCVHRISPAGTPGVFYRGLGRPQGIAFDEHGNLYVAASIGGRRGIVRITPGGQARLFLSGPNVTGLAFAPSTRMYVTTTSALYRLDAGVQGMTMPNLQ
ncbi:MAG: gluconolaconase [Acidobacteria bacterium]|nr:gluconolaconase [Acidobacteriota bacterium]